MGVSTLQVRTRQQHTTTRCSQDGNTAKGPLQQHLQLQAGNITTYAQIRSIVIEYYRATASFTRLQAITSGNNSQGPAAMDIGATWCNKGKRKKGKRKGKGKYNKGKGYVNYRNNYSNNNYKGGKGKYSQQPVGQGNPLKGQHGYGKGKGYSAKGKGKDTTTTNQEEKEQKENKQQMFATDVDNQDTWPSNAEWRSATVTQEPSPMTRQMTGATNNWYHQDQSQMHHLALPQPPQVADPSAVPISELHEVTIATIGATQQPQQDNK